MRALMRVLKNEEGVTAIEYALICALIALVIIFGATQAGQWLNGAFVYVANTLQASGVPAAVPAP